MGRAYITIYVTQHERATHSTINQYSGNDKAITEFGILSDYIQLVPWESY
jgi:hypothetical protein